MREVGSGGGYVVPARDEATEFIHGGAEFEFERHGSQCPAHGLQRVEAHLEFLPDPRALRQGPFDVLDAQHEPVVIDGPEQAGSGHAGRERSQLAGFLAVGLGERALGHARCGLDEHPTAVPTGEDGREPGSEAGLLTDHVDHGGPQALLDGQSNVWGQEMPLEAARRPAPRNRNHGLILTDRRLFGDAAARPGA